jgi:hypothetical protein
MNPHLLRKATRLFTIGWPYLTAAGILLLSFWIPSSTLAGTNDSHVCDVNTDYFLGAEDYADAIRVHREILRKDAINALAHYHLGFALGMVNDRTAELREYRRAETLGLRNWDLFLNMGLAQLESILTILPNESCRSVVMPKSRFRLPLSALRCRTMRRT